MQHRTRPARPSRPHKVAMLAYPQAQILDITGPLEIFARTSRWLCDHAGRRTPAYEIDLVAARRGLLTTSGGLQIRATCSIRELGRTDTLLVTGGLGYQAAARQHALLQWIRTQAAKAQRIGSVCTGALVLARVGLLDGQTVTTHWAYCAELARLAPRALVQADALYVRSGKLYTSAGVTAGMDMALAMVEEDWGKTVALAVAQELVMFLKRPGGQSQFSRLLAAQQRDDTFGRLEMWILEHLDTDLSIPRLAEQTNLSPRHFARRFLDRVGTTPAAYVARARLEAARRRLEDGAEHLKEVARACGFGDEQSLRRAFKQTLGVTPQEYRARFAR